MAKRLGVLLLCMGLFIPVAVTAQARTQSRFAGMAARRSVDARSTTTRAQPRSNVVSGVECLARSGGTNTKLDCDDPLPNNEPDIEVDPADPSHMSASSNDYGTCCDEFYTSFDAGRSWVTGNMSKEDDSRTGSDPVTVFDPVSGNTLHASLNYIITDEGLTDDGDLVVSISKDGGVTWDTPVVVAGGIGDDDDPLQLFNDKEWIVTDTNPSSPYYGRTYLTWTVFRSENGEYVESPIMEAHSDDGGETWTAPQEISGDSPTYCTFQTAGPAGECDENQFSVPTVSANGTVYVAYENGQNDAAWEPGEQFEDQYMVVRSIDGGATFTRPTHVVDLEDGSLDYPINVDGRQTMSGFQLRVNSAGNIVASPEGRRLYLVFSDNRAGVRDGPTPVTNTNVYYMTSRDGVSWRGPKVVDDSSGDQWFPWGDVNPTNGKLGVVYNDRNSPKTYDATLATRSAGGFTYQTASTKSSHPNNSLFFQAGVSGCKKCATFNGDYTGLDYGSDGKANVVWTDMRDFFSAGPVSGFQQFVYYARM